ncbi:hypothetical protein ACNUDN_15620 [Mycobacterium sp. smrl_JER01]
MPNLSNLVIAEMYLRALRHGSSAVLRLASLLAPFVAATVVVIGVYSQW